MAGADPGIRFLFESIDSASRGVPQFFRAFAVAEVSHCFVSAYEFTNTEAGRALIRLSSKADKAFMSKLDGVAMPYKHTY